MTEQNRKFKGVWIPRDLWFSKELSVEEKIMLIEIDSLDNEDGCYAGNKIFADFFQIKERQVRNHIEGLKDKGLIAHHMVGRNKRVIILTKKGKVLMAESCHIDGKKVPSADGNKVPHSNTEESNTNNSIATRGVAGIVVNDCIDLFKGVNPTWERLFSNKTERAAMERLIAKFGQEAVKKMIEKLPDLINRPFYPKITRPYELERDLGKLTATYQQDLARAGAVTEKTKSKFIFS